MTGYFYGLIGLIKKEKSKIKSKKGVCFLPSHSHLLVERILETVPPPRNSTPEGWEVVHLSLYVSFLIHREGLDFCGEGLYLMFSYS